MAGEALPLKPNPLEIKLWTSLHWTDENMLLRQSLKHGQNLEIFQEEQVSKTSLDPAAKRGVPENL